MNKRYISINAYSLCVILLIPTSQTFSSDGTQGWIVSMAKAAGNIALKAIGAGMLGGTTLDYRQQQRMSDRWNGTKSGPSASLSTGTVRDEGPRGLEAPIQKELGTQERVSNTNRVRSSDQKYEYNPTYTPTAYTDSAVSALDHDITDKKNWLKHLRENEKNVRHLDQRHQEMMNEIYQLESYIKNAETHREHIRPSVQSDIAKSISDRQAYPDATLDKLQNQYESGDANNKQILNDIKREKQKRMGERMTHNAKTTLTQATAMVLTSQAAGTTSTQTVQTVKTEEERLYESIKAREAQMEKWKNSIWPSDWVSIHTAREYEKVTQTEREKLATIKWANAKEQYHKHEGEKYQENSNKMIDHRNNGDGGNGGGDKEPDKDPNLLKHGAGLTVSNELANQASKSGKHGSEPHTTPKIEHYEAPKPQDQNNLPKPQHVQGKVPGDIVPELNKPYRESGILPQFPTEPNRVHHIWDDRTGHFNTETEKSKQAMLQVIMDPTNHIGQNRAGNQVYAGPSDLCGGQQVWIHTRNGVVVDAGINKTSWTRDQILTSKRPVEAQNDGSQFWSLVGGAFGFEAITSSSNAEAAEIKAKLNAPLITTKAEDLRLPDAPKDIKPHFTTQPYDPLKDLSKIATKDFTKFPIGATSNKEGFTLSQGTIDRILSSPVTSTPNVTDLGKPATSMPTLTLPSAPAEPKPYVPTTLPPRPSVSDLKLPTASSSSSSKNSSSSSSYKPVSTSSYKPTSSSSSYKPSFGGSSSKGTSFSFPKKN